MSYKFSKNKILIIFLIFLVFLGIFGRAVEIINQNYLWGFDQGREYLMTRDIVVNHHLTLIGTALGAGSAGIQGIFHGPGYYYFLAIPFIIFNGDPYGGVVLMFVFSLSVLLVAYLLGCKMFGKAGGLILLAMFSLSPPLMSQARSIWSPHPSTLFVILSFYFTYLIGISKKKIFLYIFLAAFFAGFIYNFEFAIAIPLTLGLIIYSLFKFKKDIVKYVILVSGFLIAYLPMILFEIRHKFMALNGIVAYLNSPKSSHGPAFVQNVVDHWGSFIYNVSGSFPSQNLIPPLLLLALLVVSAIYLVGKEKRVEVKSFIIYLMSLPLITFIILTFLRNTVYPNYLYHLNVLYLILFVYILLSFNKSKNNNTGKYVFSFLSLFFLIVAIPANAKMITYDLKDYGGDAKIKGKEAAIDYIYKDANGQKFGLLVFSPPVYTYPYDYLLVWYGQKKYGYTPTQSKKGLFYLLIEVDPAKPWSYQGWIQTVIKSGKVISEAKLPSGLIVQKRFQE